MIPKCPGRANGNAWRRNSPSCPSRPPATDGKLALTPAEDTTRWEFLEWQIQHAQQRLATIETRAGGPRGRQDRGAMTPRARQAGLRLEDVARPSPRKRARRNRLDAMLRAALAQLASGRPAERRAGPRRRPKI